MIEAAGIFVQYGFGPEEFLVPVSAPIEIRDGDRDVSDSWKPSHSQSPFTMTSDISNIGSRLGIHKSEEGSGSAIASR